MELRIKELCIKRNISVTELGRLVGMKKSTIHTTIINGNPTLETLEKIATALNVGISELFRTDSKAMSGLINYKGVAYTVDGIETLKRIVLLVESDSSN